VSVSPARVLRHLRELQKYIAETGFSSFFLKFFIFLLLFSDYFMGGFYNPIRASFRRGYSGSSMITAKACGLLMFPSSSSSCLEAVTLFIIQVSVKGIP
jgi:hypothetical protein